MSIDEIIKALEDTATLFEIMRRHQPGTGKSGTAVALREAIALLRTHKTMRNELCLKCGQYKDAHLGACNGCRWRREENT